MSYPLYADYAPTPAPLTSGSTIQSFVDPQGDVWVALNGVRGGNWYRAINVLHSRWYRNAALTLPTGSIQAISLDTAASDPYTLYNGSVFTAPVAGLYLCGIQILATATASAQRIGGYMYTTAVAGNYCVGAQTYTASAAPIGLYAAGPVVLAAGQTVATQAITTPALAANTGYNNTYAHFDYIGTG